MKKIYILILSIITTSGLFGQSINRELVSTTGENFKNEKYELAWSIGETITETFSTTQIILSNGFSQGNLQVTSIYDEKAEQGIEVLLYPNPATESITVDLTGSNFIVGDRMDLYLSDINGKTIRMEKMKSKRRKIILSGYENGLYFLTIRKAGQIIGNFKIIKN